MKHVELWGGVMSNEKTTFLEVFLLEPRTLIPAVFSFPYGNSHWVNILWCGCVSIVFLLILARCKSKIHFTILGAGDFRLFFCYTLLHPILLGEDFMPLNSLKFLSRKWVPQVDLPQLRYNVPDTYQDLFFVETKITYKSIIAKCNQNNFTAEKRVAPVLDDAVWID